MMPAPRDFVVLLRDRSGREIELPVTAETPHLAVHIGERAHDAQALEIVERRRVAGRCAKCGEILFAGDGNLRRIRGVLRLCCWDCDRA